jgi:hypothetical protein
MHAGLLERKAAQEEPANQMGEERVDRDRAKATLGGKCTPGWASRSETATGNHGHWPTYRRGYLLPRWQTTD